MRVSDVRAPGKSRSSINGELSSQCQRLARWYFMFTATKQADRSVRKMPRAGPVVFHATSMKREHCHGTSPWHPKKLGPPLLATNVSDHRAGRGPSFSDSLLFLAAL